VNIFGLFSPGLRAGLLVAMGSALLAGPFALGLSMAAVATGVAVGTVAIGLGLAGTDTHGRGTIPLSAHATYDLGLGLGLVAAGLLFGANGDTAALGFFGAAGVLQLTICALTSYKPPRPTSRSRRVTQSFPQ